MVALLVTEGGVVRGTNAYGPVWSWLKYLPQKPEFLISSWGREMV